MGTAPIVECVANFSEGRREEVIQALVEAVTKTQGVSFLDLQKDGDHNRCVLTFVGPPEALSPAVLAAIGRSVDLIDLNTHQGEHPRMGACDVVPFVPIRDVTLEDCARLAREVGRTIGESLSIPVFLYEAAASRPERRNLADVRKPQFEGLRDLIGTDPDRLPDFGPSRIHPTAGAVAVGARMPLIAYNVDLDSEDLKLAKKIAKQIRERGGGFPGIKALGMLITDRKCAQVSMNVCDYTRTSLQTVYSAIEEHAKAAGVSVRSSEVVGLLPATALQPGWVEKLKITSFSDQQIIENRI